jgi:hypothetical protein
MSELPAGTRMNRISSSQNSGSPSRPRAAGASLVRGRRAAGRGRRHASAGGRDSGSGGSALGQRTMFASNHVLMLASREPQVYGLMVWVATLVSGGSPARGATPCSTG